MSFDATISHLRTQLTDGATRRRRTEHRRLVAALSTAALAVIVAAGALALAPDDDAGNVLTTTAIATEQRAVCDAFLHALSDASLAPLTARQTAPVVELAARLPSDDPLSAGRYLSTPDDPRFADAYNALDAGCRDLGHPDFNLVYVAAPIPTPVDVPEQYRGATAQLFRGATEAPADFDGPIHVGRNMSTVQTAVTDAGAFLVTWSYDDSSGRRRTCTTFGLLRTGGANCHPTAEPPRRADPLDLLSGSSFPYRLTAVATAPEVAVLVATSDNRETIVQQPVLGHAVIVWTDATGTVITLRGFAADGTLVACRRTDGATCS